MLRYVLPYVVLLSCSSALALAQEMPVPVDMQYKLLLKVLSFDRNLNVAEQESLNIGVVYQRGFRMSLRAKEDFVAAAQREMHNQAGPLVKIIPIELNDETDITAAIQDDDIDALYIAPLRARGIEHIIASARATQTLTTTGVVEFMKRGAAVGISGRNGKPQVVINLAAAKAEGADFSSQLLKVAKISGGQ